MPHPHGSLGLGVVVAVLAASVLGCGSGSGSGSPSTAKSSTSQRTVTATGHSMTYRDAYVLKLGTTYAAVLRQFGTPIPAPAGAPTRVHDMSCVYYAYAGHRGATFELCFKRSRLAVLSTRL